MGQKLESEWWETIQQTGSKIGKVAAEAIPHLLNMPEYLFYRACRDCADGNPSGLIEYLRSGRPMPEEFRDALAEMLEGKYDRPKKKRGRPRHTQVHLAASLAGAFYREWRARCLAAGVDHYGLAHTMQLESIRIVQELDDSLAGVDSGKVRQLMDAPRRRRK
jgi:hypothetical protein